MHIDASNVLLLNGNLTASQQKVSLDSSADTFNKTGDRSQPIVMMSGFTPKYFPSPHPISRPIEHCTRHQVPATREPRDNDSKNTFTRCQYT